MFGECVGGCTLCGQAGGAIVQCPVCLLQWHADCVALVFEEADTARPTHVMDHHAADIMVIDAAPVPAEWPPLRVCMLCRNVQD